MAALTCATGAAAEQTEDTLLVWTGDQARKVPDFVAVMDFDRDSPDYGKVLRIVPLPPPLLKSNEAHHVGISRDGRTLALGGLLSILSGQDQVFFFDVADRRHPTFIKSDNPPDASIADEFDSLSTGGLLATFMGGPNGAHPGRVVEYDARLNFVHAWPDPAGLPTDGFNPMGSRSTKPIISWSRAISFVLCSASMCMAGTWSICAGVSGSGILRVEPSPKPLLSGTPRTRRARST